MRTRYSSCELPHCKVGRVPHTLGWEVSSKAH